MTQNKDKNPVQQVTGTGTLDHAWKPAANGKQDHGAKDKKHEKERSHEPARATTMVDKDNADRKNPKSS